MLSLTDIYFLLLTVLRSTFKLMRVNNFVNEEEVMRFISMHLMETPKLNVSILIK